YDEEANSDEGPILGSKWRAIFGNLDSGDDLKADNLDRNNLKKDLGNFFNYQLDDYARMYDSEGDSDELDNTAILSDTWRKAFALED
ncbi:hypothetical protein PQX77_012618, partial [Marasmius sp. AFHP31]